MLESLLIALAKTALVLGPIMGVFAPVLTWVERRMSAYAQDRSGPNRAGITIGGRTIRLWGLIYPLADALKLFTKEDFVPTGADKWIHRMAPCLAVFAALVAWGFIPFGPEAPVLGRLLVADLDVGLVALFALMSFGTYAASLGGWASNSKLALLGALRSSAQMISYEVVFGLTLIGVFMTYETLNPFDIVEAQKGFFDQGLFLQPLAMVLFFWSAIAETKRGPFDIPEGESEIVGYFAEYSGMSFAMFYTAEFIGITIVSGLTTTLFLGGYHWYIGEEFIREAGGPWLYSAVGFLVFWGKVAALSAFQVLLRWSLPRFRYDQLMNLCWKGILPLSLANVLVTGGALLIGDGPFGILPWVGGAQLLAMVIWVWPKARASAKGGAHGAGHGAGHGHASPEMPHAAHGH